MKFGIHGSCVTRDMFGFLGKEEFLGFYQARSSLSTKGPHRKDIDEPGMLIRVCVYAQMFNVWLALLAGDG